MVTSSLIEKLRFGRASVCLEAESKQQACQIVRAVTEWADRFNQEILIFYPGCKQPYRIPSPIETYQEIQEMTNLLLPRLYIGKIEVYTPEFIGSLQRMMERSCERLGLVRVRDNKQILMSFANSQHLQATDLNQNVALKREDYWNRDDLEAFNQLWHQELRHDGSNSIEFTYRALTNVVQSQTDWSKFTTRYRLLADGQEIYQYAELLDVVPIKSPLESR